MNLRAKKLLKAKEVVLSLAGSTVIIIAVLGFGFLIDKLLEAFMVLCGYFSTRFLVPKIKHFSTPVRCIFVSTFTFSFAIAILCIPRHISIVWSALVGAFIPVVMYIESLLFDPVVRDIDWFLQRCRDLNYNSLKTQMAIKFFHEKEKPREVWLWLCETQPQPMEWESVRKAKYRMKKEIFQDAE